MAPNFSNCNVIYQLTASQAGTESPEWTVCNCTMTSTLPAFCVREDLQVLRDPQAPMDPKDLKDQPELPAPPPTRTRCRALADLRATRESRDPTGIPAHPDFPVNQAASVDRARSDHKDRRDPEDQSDKPVLIDI